MIKDKLFSKLHVLENDRAMLVPLQPEHFEPLWEVASDASIWTYMSVQVNKKDEFKDYFDSALRERNDGLAYPFAVFDKMNKCWAGSTRFGSLALEHKRLEIGWTWYRKTLHGSGLNTACKLLLLDFAFNNLGLNRVELKTSLLNLRSQKAMEKLGAVKEGVFRRHMINQNGSVRDSVFYSFIREEWAETKMMRFKDF